MAKQFFKIIFLACFLIFQISNIYSQDVISIARNQFDKFNNVKNGWLAGDATISLLLPDGKTLWLFGDSFIGEKSGEFSIYASNASFINNCAIIEDDTSLTAYYGGTIDNPSSLIPSEGNDIFWPEHATIENDTIKIFAIQIIFEDNGIPGFNFRIGRTHIASFKYPEMKYISTKPIECITDTNMRFGAYVLKRDDYTYIFGKKDTTIQGMNYPVPMLARVINSVSEPWEFFAGSDTWSYNCEDAKPIGDRPMSESFFVYEKNDKFYLIMHEIWTVGELFILEADEITGPWNRASSGGIENCFCIIPKYGNNFTYNLFAHPQFKNDDRILISFNVNTSNFNSIYTDTRNYRARFLWLSVEDAVTTSIPDTVYIFKDFTDIPYFDLKDNNESQYFKTYDNKIIVKSTNTHSVLRICDINGKMLYYQNLNADLTLNLYDFPNTVFVIKLINEKGTFTKKIINIY